MCRQWQAFGVGAWGDSESKQAPGRSSKLVERLLELDSRRVVNVKLWAAVGRFLALGCGRRFWLQSHEQCQDKWYGNASLVLTQLRIEWGMSGMGLGARELFGSSRCARVPARCWCHQVLCWLICVPVQLCPCPSPAVLLKEPKQKGFTTAPSASSCHARFPSPQVTCAW